MLNYSSSQMPLCGRRKERVQKLLSRAPGDLHSTFFEPLNLADHCLILFSLSKMYAQHG